MSPSYKRKIADAYVEANFILPKIPGNPKITKIMIRHEDAKKSTVAVVEGDTTRACIDALADNRPGFAGSAADKRREGLFKENCFNALNSSRWDDWLLGVGWGLNGGLK